MGKQCLQQFPVSSIVHFMPILLPVPGFQHIRRIAVNQDILVVEPPNHIHGRLVFYLYPTETFCRLKYFVREMYPVLRRICLFPALYIILPADLLAIRPESMPPYSAGYRNSLPVRNCLLVSPQTHPHTLAVHMVYNIFLWPDAPGLS